MSHIENELVPYYETITFKEDGAYNQHGVKLGHVVKAPEFNGIDDAKAHQKSRGEFFRKRIDEAVYKAMTGEGEGK